MSTGQQSLSTCDAFVPLIDQGEDRATTAELLRQAQKTVIGRVLGSPEAIGVCPVAKSVSERVTVAVMH